MTVLTILFFFESNGILFDSKQYKNCRFRIRKIWEIPKISRRIIWFEISQYKKQFYFEERIFFTESIGRLFTNIKSPIKTYLISKFILLLLIAAYWCHHCKNLEHRWPYYHIINKLLSVTAYWCHHQYNYLWI